MKNDFLDEIIKDKLNSQEYEFTSSDWSSFEKKRGKSKSTTPNTKWIVTGVAATILVAAASFIWLANHNNNPSETHEDLVETKNNDHKTIVANENYDKSELKDPIHKPYESLNLDNPTNINPEVTTSETQEGHQQTNNATTDQDKIQNNIDNQTTNNNQAVNPSGQENTNIIHSDYSEIAIPSAIIMTEAMEVCQGEFISFETIEQEDVTYSWSLGDDTYINDRIVSHKYNNPGKYAVSLIVTSSIDHSILSKSKDITIEVLPAPNTNFTVQNMENEIIPSIQLITEEELPSYHWTFGDGTTSSESAPVKSYKRKGYYNVTLSSKNHEGCSSETTKKITIKEDYNLLAPNSFTPNGDGINDYFIPEALKTMDAQFTMTVYSKNEGLIFETKNINQQWDGRNQQNGQNCEEDTYIWVVSLTTKEGKSEHYKGAVLLLK